MTTEEKSIAAFVESAVAGAFGAVESPRYLFPTSIAVELLFELCHHQVEDPQFGEAGGQVLNALQAYHQRQDLLNLPDRTEAFLKMVHHLLRPRNVKSGPDEMFLPVVLKALHLADDATLRASSIESIESLEGKPRFAQHVARVVMARNDVHRAPSRSHKDKSIIFESICVLMVFAVSEFRNQIELALLTDRNRPLLERYDATFATLRERFVDVEGHEQSTDAFEGIDPLAEELVEDNTSNEAGDITESEDAQIVEAKSSPEQRRGLVRELIQTIPRLVLLGDPGAGKTTTLQYLAHDAARKLLKSPAGQSWFPIYIPLKTFATSGRSTLDALIQAELNGSSLKTLAENPCLFLLDGFNEISEEHLMSARNQIDELLTRYDRARVVITCRPGQFQNEFSLPIFRLQPLKDEQIQIFLKRHLRSEERVRKFASIMRQHPKLWEWARNPFMLWMLIRVFAKSDGLPENRGRLMQAFVGGIMHREKVQRAGLTDPAVKLSLLGAAAFESRRLALLAFPRSDAYKWVKQKRDTIGCNLDVPEFIQEVINNNIFSTTSGDLVTFDHELYQEYFCAVALLEMGDSALAALGQLQSDPRWAEPIILYSGLSAHRSRVLRSLVVSNVHLAAKSLTSSSSDEPDDREAIVARAKAMSIDAADPTQVAEGLLSLAELGETELVFALLEQLGEQKETTRNAIQSVIPKCKTDTIVDWITITARLSNNALLHLICTAVADDQKDAILQGYAEHLKATLLLQFYLPIGNGRKVKVIKHLLTFVGKSMTERLFLAFEAELLSGNNHLVNERWRAYRYILSHPRLRLVPENSSKVNDVFRAALNSPNFCAKEVAAYLWRCGHHKEVLSNVCKTVENHVLKNTLKLLRMERDLDCHQFGLALAHEMKALSARPNNQVARTWRTSPARLQQLVQMKPGDIRKGCRINSIVNCGVFVELAPGIDGLLHLADMSWDHSTARRLSFQPNQIVDVMLLEVDLQRGEILVGHKQLAFAVLEALQKTIETEYPVGTEVTGVITGVVKGGMTVNIGIEAFLPASQFDITPPKTPEQCIGNTYKFKVIKTDLDIPNVVLSRRIFLEMERTVRRGQLLATIAPNDICKGTVKNITDFGAFIDLNGLDGLLHITDMSWSRIGHPNEILKVGQEIEVLVLDVNHEKSRVSLGLKQKLQNPWEAIESKFPVGTKVKGKVLNLAAYGAFIELQPGVEGLVHATELSWIKRIVKPSDVLKPGQEIEAVVLGINRDEQKISLSIRQLESNPWEQAHGKYPPGTKIKGKVRNLTSYGAFVELEEGLDGMVHLSDISWTRKIKQPSEAFQIGDLIEAVMVAIDPEKRTIALSIKALSRDPWLSIGDYFTIGALVTGTVVKTSRVGATLVLKHGFHALVHKSQIPLDSEMTVKDALPIGRELAGRVIAIDTVKRRIGLSMRLGMPNA